MKPEKRAKYAAVITLAKGKMYEYGVPEDDHLELPPDLDLEMQFPLAIGTIGDFASETVGTAIGLYGNGETPGSEVIFAAQVLQAFDDSRLDGDLSWTLRLLSAAGFYLGNVPGNAAVQISKLSLCDPPADDPLAQATVMALDKPWAQVQDVDMDPHILALLNALGDHFTRGGAGDGVVEAIRNLHRWAYASATPHELLLADLLGAISVTRIANSAWTLLPKYSGLPLAAWEPYLSRSISIKEMWPSQRMLGEAGLYGGQSGIVQMPTSVGKSRATELVIRSAFLSKRTKLALVIAPFRALCQEIATDFEGAFKEDGYNVNQISDALQSDIDLDIFDIKIESKPQVVVVTPEKLLYALRQAPEIIQKAGLVVYDEGHQFDTGARGVTYELLLTSIKRLLPENAQSVLISAVIQNATAVSTWLLNNQLRVVSDRSLQTRRLVAFASLPKGKDGQLQFNVASAGEQVFFVPRVIVPEKLSRLRGEKKDRFFPTQKSGSVAMYLGLRLIKNGGVAIYAGKKNSAAKIVRDAVEEVFQRGGISLAPPSAQSDPEEIRRFIYLYKANFGTNTYLSKAAALGIFAHHGNTPHGIRLAIEYAMRQRLIRLIVCTSTLAQGVNLPIRYLLVTSAMQGRELIKARDFHNLMGRAGRAGMYGEGTVIFTDHRLYDEQTTEKNRWNNSVNLISPESAEPTGSTLLSLFDPMRNDTGIRVLNSPSPAIIATNIVDDWAHLYEDIGKIRNELILKSKFSVASLRAQLEAKKRIIEAIESFLMTYRSDVDSEVFIANSKVLAGETLAYSLASPEQQKLLTNVFESVARRIEKLVPDTGTQHRFGLTLLGIDQALAIEVWMEENLQALEQLGSEDELFELLWPLMVVFSKEKLLTQTDPKGALKDLAKGWLAGRSFGQLLQELDAINASYPYGRYRRGFGADLIVGLCEHTFGFESALLLAAVSESFAAIATEDSVERFKDYADLLQKRLKYGLPNRECIAYFEAGFADRVIAQALSLEVFWETAKTTYDVRRLAKDNLDNFEEILGDYPSHFTHVLQIITAPQV